MLAHSVALDQQFSIFPFFRTAELPVFLLGIQKFYPVFNELALNLVKMPLQVCQQLKVVQWRCPVSQQASRSAVRFGTIPAGGLVRALCDT